jgi:ABC-type Fe3+/spermidine/putrescine transport system ATPase subunit
MALPLVCKDVRKTYDGDVYALGSADRGVDIHVEAGELFALLGPSGCGKTTTLRIIGGFIEPSSGTVRIGDDDVTRRRPYERPTNTVFQTYALFPHMSLGANVAFGLSMERVTRGERNRRVAEALELVGLAGMEKRRVTEMSGGQAQRAALARAIVKRPAVLLLDEPLGALDLKLRRQMQDELVRLKGETSTTFVHVTHDQEEACAIADRIAVMQDGQVVQVDTPIALFREPRTAYVAEFIDAGTLVRGEATASGDVVEVASPWLTVRGLRPGWLDGSGGIAAVLSPDRVHVEPARHDSRERVSDEAYGEVARVVFTGSVYDVHVLVAGTFEVKAALSVDDVRALGDAIAVGSDVRLSWASADVIFVEDRGLPATATGQVPVAA